MIDCEKYKIKFLKSLSGFLVNILIVLSPSCLFAQDSASMQSGKIKFITDQLEIIAEQTDLNLDYSDLVDDYLFYSKNPININSSQSTKLMEIRLINQIQLNNLRSYINLNGPLLSVFELSYIPGFDKITIQQLLPFIKISQTAQQRSFNLKNVFQYGSNQLIMRYGQVVEPSEGYAMPTDSAIAFPSSVFLGSPAKYYARYAFNYRNQIRFGVTADKDAGEVIIKNSLSDTILSVVGPQISNIFDFYSAHAYVSDIGILKEAVIGDYHLEFGQGLTMWSGLAFGKSAQSIDIKRFGQGIRPNTSVNENRFFRGGAFTLGRKNVDFTAFYSKNNIDANTVGSDLVTEETVSSIQETGLHRTINELLDKRALTVDAYGGRVSFSQHSFEIGVTAFQTKLSSKLISSDEMYKMFSFSGNGLTNFGIDFSYNLNKINFFGEVAGSDNGGLAGIAGINAFLSDRFIFSFLYHNYGKKYQNLYANPFAESGAIANENGLYFGFNALLHKKWSLSGYFDYYRFPWLRYGVSAPSLGSDFLLQLNYTPIFNTTVYIRFRHKTSEENYKADYDYTPLLATVQRDELRFYASYTPFDFLVLINRIDFVLYKNEFENKENGYLIYQDVVYRPARFPLEVTFRYAIFSTDTYNSRIFTYENDVLYSFTIPSYYDRGQRFYLMLKWEALNYLDVWFRIGRTTLNNRNTVGSGVDEISGNHKTEVKVQVMLKL